MIHGLLDNGRKRESQSPLVKKYLPSPNPICPTVLRGFAGGDWWQFMRLQFGDKPQPNKSRRFVAGSSSEDVIRSIAIQVCLGQMYEKKAKSFRLPGVIRWIYGCQKWIPDKILHRNSDSIFFSTLFFRWQKIILKMKKYFRKFFKGNFHFALKLFRWRILSGIHFWHP